jgi:membrane-associated protein
MISLLGSLLSYVLLYKYEAIFIIVYSAAVILPLPGNAMLLAIGAFSSQGYFNYWLALAVAVTANTLGDLTDYAITRKYSRWIVRALRLEKIIFFVRLKEELVADAAATVFTTRFAGSLSPVAAILAGLVKVPFKTFITYDFLGNFIEPFAALSLGYAAGNYWSDFSGLQSIIAGIVAVGVVMFILIRIYRRITKKYSG